jgi:hypothetical protein
LAKRAARDVARDRLLSGSSCSLRRPAPAEIAAIRAEAVAVVFGR